MASSISEEGQSTNNRARLCAGPFVSLPPMPYHTNNFINPISLSLAFPMHRFSLLALSVVLVVLILQLGCGPKAMMDEQTNTKMDAPLRMELNELTEAQSEELIQCFVKFADIPNANQRAQIQQSGVTILTDNGDIFTVEGPAQSLRSVAQLDFIVSMSLSQTR